MYSYIVIRSQMIGKVVQGFSSSFPDVGNHQLGIVILIIIGIILLPSI